jgi:hypothetical protein
MLAVEYFRLQRKGIHPIHTIEVNHVLPRPSGRFAEGMDTAVLAEIVLRLLLAKLIQTKRAFLRVDTEFFPRHRLDHGSPLGTERAVAAYTMCEWFRLERELDRAAVATAFVWLHYHFACISCLRLALPL